MGCLKEAVSIMLEEQHADNRVIKMMIMVSFVLTKLLVRVQPHSMGARVFNAGDSCTSNKRGGIVFEGDRTRGALSCKWKLSNLPKMFVGTTEVKLQPYSSLYMRFCTSTRRFAYA
jgi:hypothetical protein